jgi:UDP-2,3-diacylglucosamine hydrolase
VSSLLVSDLHLTTRRPETTDLFLEFLAGPACDASAVYILGDLFDYWVGDDDAADALARRICGALAVLTGAGTAAFFMPGNRDFLVGKDFAAACGLSLLADPTVCDIAGQRTLLLHGDTLCTDDTEYQDFRVGVRSAAWREEFLAWPLATRKAKVAALRARSETEKQSKAGELMDVNAKAVASAFRRHAVTRMVHGHTHRQGTHNHRVDGRSCQRWVLGDWGSTGNALLCDASGCRWLHFPR